MFKKIIVAAVAAFAASADETQAIQIRTDNKINTEQKQKEADDAFFDGISAQKAGEEAAYLLAQQQHPLVKARARAKARSQSKGATVRTTTTGTMYA